MLAAGCGNKDNILTDMETEPTETVIDTEEPDMAEDEEIPATEQAENGVAGERQTGKEPPEETEPEEGDKEAAETPEPQSVSQPEQKEETEPAQGSTDVPKQEETKQQEQTVTAVSYDPVSVCSQAVAKCQAGGMITTTDNLASLLAEGRITQEEYNSYYPYDGLGYYSVFVETKTLEGFVLDDTPIEADLSYIDQDTRVVYAGMNISNERQKVQIRSMPILR